MGKNYSLYRNLYNMLEIRYSRLCNELFKFAEDCKYGNSNFMTSQEWSQNVLEHGSRFYRNIFEIPGSLTKLGKGQIPQALEQKKRDCITEEEFENKSDEEKKHLIKDLWKENAIINARLANIYNRNAHTAQNHNKVGYRTSLFGKKDVATKEFLMCAITYNKYCTRLGLENDHIAFGFSKDPEKGSMILQSSLPGFSRLSVHLGTFKNFKDILEAVNKFCGLENNEKITANNATTKYRYSLPTFERNMGIINKDDFNESQLLAEQFKQKARTKNGSIDKRGMEEFVYFMNSNMKLNDRELFHLAELGGLGKGFLTNLSSILQERKKMQVEARKEGVSIADYYVLQQLSQVRNKEELQNLFDRLWDCRQLELDNAVEQEDRDEFKEYFIDMANKAKQRDGGDKKTDLYTQLLEMASSSEIELEDLKEADNVETNLESNKAQETHS